MRRRRRAPVGSPLSGLRSRPPRRKVTLTNRGSPSPLELEVLCVAFLRDDANDLAGLDRLTRRDRQAGDVPAAVGRDLVLHLHRLHDADHLTLADLVPE